MTQLYVNIVSLSIVSSFLQVACVFLYLGSKFLKDEVRLPSYLSCRGSVSLEKVKDRLSNDMYQFIKSDLEEFAAVLKPSGSEQPKSFKKVNGQMWLFSMPYHVILSEIKLPGLISWGIEMQEGEPVSIKQCDEISHYGHSYLAPFHLMNSEVFTYYNDIMMGSNGEEKELIRGDFELLEKIKCDPNLIPHENTKFHCVGHPFKSISYREGDWSARLYYSIKNHLPDYTSVRFSHAYQYNFAGFQELLSHQTSPSFYIFRGVPDLVFTTRKTMSVSTSASLHMDDDEFESVEVKHGDHLSTSREKPSGLPNAAAQVVGTLHMLAASRVIRAVQKNTVPSQVKCKGLLLKRKDHTVKNKS